MKYGLLTIVFYLLVNVSFGQDSPIEFSCGLDTVE